MENIHDLSCGRMSQGLSPQTKARTSKAVLEAVIGVVCPGTEVPMPEKNRWPYADIYMGRGDGALHTELSDAQILGESPSEDAASSLSQILQAGCRTSTI